MTLIFLSHDFWIETFVIAPTSVPAGALQDNNLTLTKPGRFVGASIVLDANLGAADMHFVAIQLRSNSGATLAYGDSIIALRTRRGNGAAGALTFGLHAIIFMKK